MVDIESGTISRRILSGREVCLPRPLSRLPPVHLGGELGGEEGGSAMSAAYMLFEMCVREKLGLCENME
jgi:hypothetical protein